MEREKIAWKQRRAEYEQIKLYGRTINFCMEAEKIIKAAAENPEARIALLDTPANREIERRLPVELKRRIHWVGVNLKFPR